MIDRKEYPICVMIQVYITDGNQVGSASYQYPVGKIPLDEDMVKILEQVKGQLPDGFRLMDRAETMMHYLREEKGYRGPNMVIPRSKDAVWYDPETDKDFTRLNDEPEMEDDEY